MTEQPPRESSDNLSVAGHVYEFGPFRLIPSERRLLRDGKVITLPPKALDTLLILVQQSGHVLKKDELIKLVWPDACVEESNLNHYVSVLRKALNGANEGDGYIETVRRYGFRFTADVHEVNDGARALLVHKHTRTHVVLKEEQIETSSVRANATSEKRFVGRPRGRLAFAALTIAAIALVAGLLVTRGFRLTPTPNELRTAASANNARKAEAYHDYIAGRALWNKRTSVTLFESIEHFERAIERDPQFALGYAGLADAYAFDLEHWHEAKALAQKALEIDPKLAEPHATLGFISTFWLWKKQDAEREFKEAIKLKPNYATAHQWYAQELAASGRVAEAKIEMKRALDIEPLSPVMNADMGQILYFDRRYDEAIEACKKALSNDPDFFNAHQYLVHIYIEKGLYDDAVREFLTMHEITGVGKTYFDPDALTKAYRTSAIRGFWREVALESELRGPDPYGIAQCYAGLGQKEKALRWLKRAVETRDMKPIFIDVDPAFTNFHSEPQYNQLIKQLG